MKVKTSVTLSADLLAAIDRRAGSAGKRSAFVEQAVRARLHQLEREERDRREVDLLNKIADGEISEAPDAWEYQQLPLEGPE
jgi:metal-responsive CopG/Arc/MetJ family transcriptional regulator